MHIKLEDVISHAILIFVVVSYLQQLNNTKKKMCYNLHKSSGCCRIESGVNCNFVPGGKCNFVTPGDFYGL